MNEPIISVIIPVYKVQTYLHRCIDSVLAQRFINFELILINDGSPDECGKICDEYAAKDTRILVIHKENGGVSSARNAGLDVARGKYIAFCDSDDEVTSEWLSSFIDHIKEADLCVQGVNIINEKNEKRGKKLAASTGCTLQDKRNLIMNLMKEGIYGYLFIKIFLNDIIQKNHIRFDTQATFREDEQFFSKYLEYTTTFYCIDSLTYNYFIPSTEKRYGRDPYYCLPPIFQSLERIYDGELPLEICNIHFINIKSSAVSSLLKGQIPDSYVLNLYKKMAHKLEAKWSVKDKVIHAIIIHSPKHFILSSTVIKIIHLTQSKTN